MWVVRHMCMDATQEISLYSYLYLKLAKATCFSYLLYFFFYKIGEQEGGTDVTQRQGRIGWYQGEGGGGINNVCTYK
jgi:hypothetical protein